MVRVTHWYFAMNFHCAFHKNNQCKGYSLKKALPCSGIELTEVLVYGGPNVWNVQLHEIEALE